MKHQAWGAVGILHVNLLWSGSPIDFIPLFIWTWLRPDLVEFYPEQPMLPLSSVGWNLWNPQSEKVIMQVIIGGPLGTHNIWGYIGADQPPYIKMNVLGKGLKKGEKIKKNCFGWVRLPTWEAAFF